jgi:hypothetical protein
MAAMLHETLAREHAHELLRKAEEKRCGAGLRTDRPRARMLLHVLLGRRRRRLDPRDGAATMVECSRDS